MNIRSIKNILFSLLIYNTAMIFAQQDAQYTQYMYNTISVNPAYAGSRGVLSITALHRDQWIGMEGAPSSQTFNVHAPTGKNVGLGLSVVNDAIGPVQETGFDAVFSYTVPTSLTGKLSFGLKGGGHLLHIDFMGLSRFVPEMGPTENIDRKFSPNFGAGIYYHENHFYFGMSVPNILENQYFDSSKSNAEADSFVVKERMNYYTIAGYIFDLNKNVQFKPTMLCKVVRGAPVQLDLSANLLYAEKLTLGGAYRMNTAWSALVGFQVSRRLLLGIAYDAETTQLGQSNFNKGSFEVLMRFEFFGKSDPALYPRFF